MGLIYLFLSITLMMQIAQLIILLRHLRRFKTPSVKDRAALSQALKSDLLGDFSGRHPIPGSPPHE